MGAFALGSGFTHVMLDSQGQLSPPSARLASTLFILLTSSKDAGNGMQSAHTESQNHRQYAHRWCAPTTWPLLQPIRLPSASQTCPCLRWSRRNSNHLRLNRPQPRKISWDTLAPWSIHCVNARHPHTQYLRAKWPQPPVNTKPMMMISVSVVMASSASSSKAVA